MAPLSFLLLSLSGTVSHSGGTVTKWVLGSSLTTHGGAQPVAGLGGRHPVPVSTCCQCHFCLTPVRLAAAVHPASPPPGRPCRWRLQPRLCFAGLASACSLPFPSLTPILRGRWVQPGSVSGDCRRRLSCCQLAVPLLLPSLPCSFLYVVPTSALSLLSLGHWSVHISLPSSPQFCKTESMNVPVGPVLLGPKVWHSRHSASRTRLLPHLLSGRAKPFCTRDREPL